MDINLIMEYMKNQQMNHKYHLKILKIVVKVLRVMQKEITK